MSCPIPFEFITILGKYFNEKQTRHFSAKTDLWTFHIHVPYEFVLVYEFGCRAESGVLLLRPIESKKEIKRIYKAIKDYQKHNERT